ncbi:Transcriptional regulator PhnF [Candidatus Rhodobacter oscarellae]|uniref:Transcriptional regulator PhnF n=1 Tax=Candidatus Rhodobacter oscarellae TaxID=1675527 RepID=A0A0J9EAP5_9RHOB|nr:phosphonate metabolism transcriptional regulator PhnF [Candidatus Rhodobacter lobularis]KMW58734.1 Transcriptional regulator PhnF [Candidatus Rhodobacter lobularis]
MARTPIWKSIAEALRQEIASGHYAPGDKLPTEARLASRFGVNRHTVRHALAALAEDGLVFSRRGAGVFVSHHPTDYPIGQRVRFHKNLEAAGKIPGKEVLSVETRPADADERRALGLAEAALVHAYHGLSTADGTPIAVFLSVFPAAPLPGLPAALRVTGSVTTALRACKIEDFTRASTRLTAALAGPTQALHLSLREGAPLIYSEGINLDPDGRPIEFGRTWFAGERVTLTLGGVS